MRSTSQRAPGSRFQYQVPPTSPPCSKTFTENPSLRSRWSMYMPAKPAPTTITSQASTLPAWFFPDIDDTADIRALSKGPFIRVGCQHSPDGGAKRKEKTCEGCSRRGYSVPRKTHSSCWPGAVIHSPSRNKQLKWERPQP